VLRYVGVVVLALVLGAWGTLARRVVLTTEDKKSLDDLIKDDAIDPSQWALELDYRSGPHPIHQFIAYQAYLLLKQDPAFADGLSGFPTGEEINAWDGIERDPDGWMQGRTSGDGGPLTPNIPGIGGPSPDAEKVNGKGFNQLYNGRAHYYNPWLDDGAAHTMTAANYVRLVSSIVDADTTNVRAHFAAYMAHYLSDVTSAKHADAFTLDTATVGKLTALADTWVKQSGSLSTLLARTEIVQAEALIRARAPNAAYWTRIETHVGNVLGDTFLHRGSRGLYTIAPSTVTTAVACYMHLLGTRPKAQSVDRFFTYFDPLYFNGPIIDPVIGSITWSMCAAFSEHVQWESNPAHYIIVEDVMKSAKLWDPTLTYHALPPTTAPAGTDELLARGLRLALLTKECSKEAHGDITSTKDFQLAHESYLRLAIRCVATAFRASITSLRVEALGRQSGDGQVKLTLTIRTADGKPAKLSRIRVQLRDAAGGYPSRPGWTKELSDTVPAGDALRVKMLVTNVPAGTAIDDLLVDVYGDVDGVPDAGIRRTRVEERTLEVVRNPGSGGIGERSGPIDVAVVFDTTGSMGTSLGSMRDNAISSIEKLRARSKDIRIAVTTFRDLKEKADLPHFKVKAFTYDLESAFAFLKTLTPDGGGDQPEDLLHGVSLALELWEKEGGTPDRIPNKIIIVVTDAPAHSPDSKGNTYKSIAKRAFDVDPAHIYPIVVGNDKGALATAQELADSTGGKVLHSAKGDDVADAVLEAVNTAEATYAPAAPTGTSKTSGLTSAGIFTIAGGAVLLVIGLALGRRRPEAAP
jgi:hypothetical protein